VSTDAEARDATRGGAVKLGAELLGRGLQLVTGLLLARGLGAADFGAFGVLSAIAVVAAEVADLGLQGTATRALVAGTLSLRSILKTKALLTAVFAAGAAIVHLWNPLLTPLLVYFGGAGWSEILGVALRCRGRRLGEAAVTLTLRLSGLALVAVALARGGGALECFWALALSTLPPCVVGALLLRRTPAAPASAAAIDAIAPPPAGPAAAEPGPLAILRASAPLAVNGGLALLSLRVELLVMSALRAPEEVGYFLAALQVTQVSSFVPTALSAGAMPALTREALVPKADAREAVRRRTAAVVALAAAPAAVGLFLMAPALTATLYGEAYAGTALPLAVMAMALVPLFLNTLFVHALIAAERASWLPRLTAVRVAAAGVFAVAFVPWAGAAGASAGFVLSELLLVVLGARATRRAGFAVHAARPTLVALLATLPMAAVVLPLRSHLVAGVGAGVVVFAVTTAALISSARLRRNLGYS
jgi:O-antigen/teichoic acid export membrane protein